MTKSRATLADAGIDAAVVPDLTLSFAEAPRAARRGVLLVTDSSEARKTAALLDMARRWHGARPLTLRTVPPRPHQGSNRRHWTFKAKRLLARPAPLSPWSLRYAGAIGTRGEIFDILTRQARATVCARYHAVCLALLTRLPFVATGGNTDKTAALLADIGLSNRHRTLAELAAADPATAVPDFTTEEETRIDRFLERACEEAATMFGAIAHDAHQRHSAAAE